MPELQTTTLPLMPLTTGVILPGMVVTLTADTDEAKAAVAAAERGDGRLLLVPFVDGQYARTGTIGKIENAGDLPGGIRGLIIRGIERADRRRRRGHGQHCPPGAGRPHRRPALRPPRPRAGS